MNELEIFVNMTTAVYIFSGGVTILAVLCGSFIAWFKKQEKEFYE
jgi:hypothetical protein